MTRLTRLLAWLIRPAVLHVIEEREAERRLADARVRVAVLEKMRSDGTATTVDRMELVALRNDVSRARVRG